jgi:ribonucleoside-diphosphate reductase alpha chain
VILGYLPPCIERAMHLPQFKGRIEFCGFRDPETYYNLIHHVRADVGLAPVQHTSFNAAKCLVGDTRIVTDSGIIPIRDIADEKNEVWQESSWESVEATVSYEDVSTIRLRTKKGYVIEGTPHHRLRSEGEFTAMSELGLGMKVDLSFFEFPNVPMVEIPMPLLWTKKLDKVNWETCRDDLMPRVPITKEWGRFMGLLLGDGHLGGSNDVRISCDGQESDVIEWIHDFVAGIGLNSSVKVKGSPRNVDVSIPSRSLRWLLSKIVGFHSGREKVLRVPDIIWRSPKDVVREFLRGLFEADGCACKGHIGLTSKERLLVEDVQFLLLGFGILSRIKTDYNKFYKKEYYTIIMQRQACDVFADTIGFMSKRKNDKLREIVERPHSNAFKPWEMNDEVVEIEKYNGKTVYDIQVPNGEYYMANGIVSHNSPIKFLEYSLMGVPTVASDWEPYQSVIEDGLNGALVTKQGWITEIERFLCDDDLRKGTVKEARKTCQMFDLKQVANTWADLLCP